RLENGDVDVVELQGERGRVKDSDRRGRIHFRRKEGLSWLDTRIRTCWSTPTGCPSTWTLRTYGSSRWTRTPRPTRRATSPARWAGTGTRTCTPEWEGSTWTRRGFPSSCSRPAWVRRPRSWSTAG